MFGSDTLRLPVTPSRDLERILSMPTRRDDHVLPGGPWSARLDEITPEEVTEHFRIPGGTWTLKPLQAKALVEAARSKGLVGRIPPGKGKTLIGALLPEVIGAQRALLLIPASLMGQREREIEKYRKHFRIPLERIVRVMSHAELSLPSSTTLLETLAPDAVIIDEVDAFANRESVRTDRLLKYGRKHPETLWCVMSGTVFQKSVGDAVYWFALALRHRSPLPLQRSEIETWVDVLDPASFGAQVRPTGALQRFAAPGETPRQGWNRRAAATVGVVTSTDEGVGTALNIHERPLTMPDDVKDALRLLNATWTRPDGKEFSMALDLRRLERQMSAGFFYRWEWEPDPAWLEARNGWQRVVRARLQGPRRAGMDSPFLIEQAAERALALTGSADPALPVFDSPEWRAWREHRNTGEPPTVAVSLSDYLQRDAVAWGREHVGVIWTMHDHTARCISALGGFPYYGAGDDGILDEDGTRTVVASIKAHGVGKNLQAFNKGLLTELPSSGQTYEQLFARLHRDGQASPQVDFWVYRHCVAYRRAWAAARRKAQFMRDMNGNDQRMLYATCVFDDDSEGARASLTFTPEELDVMDALGADDAS